MITVTGSRFGTTEAKNIFTTGHDLPTRTFAEWFKEMRNQIKPPVPEFQKDQKIWTIGRALSIGIQSGIVLGIYQGWSGLFQVQIEGDRNPRIFYDRQLHATEESAKLSAELMRDRKIKSLQKQIAKLEQLKF